MRKQMFPVPANEIFNKQKYTNPFIRQEGIKPPIVDHQHEDDSEDSSFYYPVDR